MSNSRLKGIYAIFQNAFLTEGNTVNMKKIPLHLGEKSGKDWILMTLTATLFSLTIVYIFTIWNLGFHSDSAAANILAREQMRTGQLLPDTWHTSTGIFLFFYNILIIPLSVFTQDQILLRDISVAIVLTVFVLLFAYFSKKFIKSNFYLIALTLFFSGVSPTVIYAAFAEAAYLIQLLKHIILLILFFCSYSEGWKIKNAPCFFGLLVYIASFSLHGPLSLAYYLLPLLGSIGFSFFFGNVKSTKDTLKKEFIGVVKTVIPMVAAALIGFVGYYFLSRSTNFSSGTNIVYPSFSALTNQFLQFVLISIGYKAGVRLFSLAGITNVLVVFGLGAAIVCTVLLFRKYSDQSFEMKLFINYSAVIFAIYLYFDFAVYCTTAGTERYFFIPLVFLIFMTSYYLYTYAYSQQVLRRIMVVVLLSIFSLPCMLSSIPQAFHYPQSRTIQLGLVNFLRENNLKHGYATFWNAGKNMVLSDFEIEIGGVNLTDPISPFLWLSVDGSYDPDEYSGESFLLLTQEENESVSNMCSLERLGTPEEILSFENYVIYVYPYNISINGFTGSDFADREYLNTLVVSDPAMKNSDGIRIDKGEIIYGPYISLSAGQYEIDLNFSELMGDVRLRFTSDCGENLIQEEILTQKEQSLRLNLSEGVQNFEIVLTTNSSAILTSVKMSKIQ